MAATKIIIVCAIISVAVCFTLPEEHEQQVEDLSEVEPPLAGNELLSRQARSPDDPKRTVELRGEDRGRGGRTASLTYTHPLGSNVDVYGKVERNFKFDDNSGHVGVSYKF